MVRIKTNVYSHKRKKKILKEARGQWGDRSKRYKEAIKSLMSSRQYAFYDRRKKKGDFRALWIVRLNAACREAGISYSRFISGLKKANIEVNRKVLSDLAITAPDSFNQILEVAKNAEATITKVPKEIKEKKVTKKAKVIKKAAKATTKKTAKAKA